MRKNIPVSEYPSLVSAARRKQGLTQSEVALIITCKQSAISMFERGNLQALATDKQEALATYLAIPWPPADTLPAADDEPTAQASYCPHFDCPSNYPYMAAARLFALPHKRQTGKYCRYCGEVCEVRCPCCSAPYQVGACCGHCGTPYLEIPESVLAQQDRATWLAAQRSLLIQLS